MKLRPLSNLLATAAVSLLLGSATGFSQTFTISSAADLFTPSFRDATNADLGLTTFFGWGTGSFDGATDDDLIDNPAITLGLGGLNGTLNQLGTADILAGSNNIYNATIGRTETLRINVPTLGGGLSTGFTTLIIQGSTASFGPGSGDALILSYPVFQTINGIAPNFRIGVNGAGVGQWWAKYELPGNQTSYNVDFTLTNTAGNAQTISIAKMTADSVYSSSGYAPDTAVVPEPATAGLVASGAIWMLGRRRREQRRK